MQQTLSPFAPLSLARFFAASWTRDNVLEEMGLARERGKMAALFQKAGKAHSPCARVRNQRILISLSSLRLRFSAMVVPECMNNLPSPLFFYITPPKIPKKEALPRSALYVTSACLVETGILVTANSDSERDLGDKPAANKDHSVAILGRHRKRRQSAVSHLSVILMEEGGWGAGDATV
ncbi:hypothetical protein L249_2196 [Ophiocordyceps polyrhachis-furcata BCC 54312]|uniref:Uncharacterized protein n=1 Tax=Ophiocordyceps polyrhachis-furcata BCC 54312 TaxID=1330021 RepID=A0A367LNK9_9HYPO|nr:hypothetical protein L249_2196 [Ophiocordyceps polyrhachis-furcata BCC 54312]